MKSPALSDLMGGYFHQDWDTYGSEDDVVDQFMVDQASVRDLLVPELQRLLNFDLSEGHLARTVEDFGAQYDPVPRYGSTRAWLQHILERAQAFERGSTAS